MDHLVKYVSYWCPIDHCVKTFLIDIDVTAGNTVDCGNAIANSLSKIGCKGLPTDVFKLRGSSSDSGGAGVGDGLGDQLKAKHLTHLVLLIVGCGIHCLQLQLSRPVIKYMGDGGLDRSNMMQMLHSAYDLQEALNWSELQRIIALAAPEVATAIAAPRMTEQERLEEQDHFRLKMDQVKGFRNFTAVDSLWPKKIDKDTGDELTSLRKLPAPILTRWHTVGETATAVWHSYVLFFQCLQITINVHGSRVAGKIASGMMPIMVQPEVFSDLALIHCYHQCYFTKQMSWMMSSKDLTKPGFQTHQMLVRYYLMDRKLKVLNCNIAHNPFFESFRATLTIPGVDREVQKAKAKGLVTEAMDSLEKHFLRWATQELLPAALMAEAPYARAVARLILGVPALESDEPFSHSIKSEVHNDIINSVFFERFIRLKFEKTLTRDGCDIDNDRSLMFPREVILAAEALLADNEDVNVLRNITEPSPTIYQDYLWSNYLPLASQTQFVESGVKDASNVSKTGRSEELRSAYAIVRSYLIHNSALSNMSAPAKALYFIQAASAFNDRQEEEMATTDNYNELFNEILEKLKNEHYKNQREKELIDRVNATGLVLRKENERQQRTVVDRTNAILKQTPYSLVKKGNPKSNDRKKTHVHDVRDELTARGCPVDQIEAFLLNDWSGMKKWLRKHEKDRVRDTPAAVRNADKAFKPQSNAKFEELQ